MTASNYSWKPLSWLQALLLLIALLQPSPANPERYSNPGADIVSADVGTPSDSNRPQCGSDLRNGKTFCTDVHNYPQLNQLTDSVLKRDFPLFIGGDEPPPPQKIVSHMLGPEPGDEQFCLATERIIYPKAGETKDKNWLFILNDNENFKQGVRVEECKNAGATCEFQDFLSSGYASVCKQMYIYRTMIAITPNGTLTQDIFKLPCCCKCDLQKMP